nr:hypothetical protein [Bacillus pumilus]
MCIEFVPLRFDVPEELLIYAEERDFPLILFTKEVKFVNITQRSSYDDDRASVSNDGRFRSTIIKAE